MKRMNDLISRQVAIDELTEIKDLIGAAIDSLELDFRTEANERERLKQVIDDIETIKGLPSAQPEIIRCKDCYHYPNELADCPLIGWPRNENDFCSHAERRIDE